MASNHMSDKERAERAQKRLMQIPREQLGPAGRILFDNPRTTTPEEQRAQLRGIDGDGVGENANAQLPLLHGVGDGG